MTKRKIMYPLPLQLPDQDYRNNKQNKSKMTIHLNREIQYRLDQISSYEEDIEDDVCALDLTTRNRAETLLNNVTMVPDITLCRNGSIDLFWSLQNGEILTNIPADINTPITYYINIDGTENKNLLADNESVKLDRCLAHYIR